MAVYSSVEWGDCNHMQRVVDSPVVRWAAALAWMGLILVLMLTPSDRAVVEETSSTFGGTDLTDAIGHVIVSSQKTRGREQKNYSPTPEAAV
jgi:hypothetical protein